MAWSEYTAPPVVETVIGIEFSSLPRFGLMALAQIPALWAQDFPVIIEQDALPPTRPIGQGPAFAFQLGSGGQPGRLWLTTEDNHLLVQVQHDRLLLNWRKLDTEAAYPGFDSLYPTYSKLLGDFAAHVANDVGDLAPLVTEWSYVNVIDSQALEAGPIFSVWSDPKVPGSSDPLLTRFQHVRSFEVATGSGQLEMSAQPVNDSVSLTLSAKCFHRPGTSIADALDSAKTARSIARSAFDAVTTESARKTWGEAP